jgi:hypothetical protein
VEKSEDKQAQVEGLSFPIKLDTGTDVISMNSTDMTFFNKDGENFIYTHLASTFHGHFAP